jgi:hypothetical protein
VVVNGFGTAEGVVFGSGAAGLRAVSFSSVFGAVTACIASTVSAFGSGGKLGFGGGFEAGGLSSRSGTFGATGIFGMLRAIGFTDAGGALGVFPRDDGYTAGGGPLGVFPRDGGFPAGGAPLFAVTGGGGTLFGFEGPDPDGSGGGGLLGTRADGGAVLLPEPAGATPTIVALSFFFCARRAATAAGSCSGLMSDCWVVAMPVGSFGGFFGSFGGSFGGSCSASLTHGTIPARDDPRAKRFTDEMKMVEVVVGTDAAESSNVQVPCIRDDAGDHGRKPEGSCTRRARIDVDFVK